MTWHDRRLKWAATPKQLRPKGCCFWCHGYGVWRFKDGRMALRTPTKNSTPCEVCGIG